MYIYTIKMNGMAFFMGIVSIKISEFLQCSIETYLLFL